MLLKRFFDEKLAQTSYLVACQHAGVALVVDPNRNTAQYVEAAKAENVRITHVTETHIHADFVSGARELAQTTGARLYLSDSGGAEWKYRYAAAEGAELLTDGTRLLVGDVAIEAVHTPGHTPEHMTFLVTDSPTASTPMGAFTGDFIFVGDVGRPDLLERAVGAAGTMESSARNLFRSLKAFSAYPDYLQIWPGHGPGSACGKALGAMPQSTLGYEKLFSWAWLVATEEEFVEKVLAGQPEPPAYFSRMKQINSDGPGPGGSARPPSISAAEMASRIQGGETVVDVRPASDFAASHSRGAINIPRNRSFLTWAGSLLPYDRDVYLMGIASDEEGVAIARELSLIGIDRIGGMLHAGEMPGLAPAGIETTSTRQVQVAELADARVEATVVDVRGRSEFEQGHIPGAVHIPLGQLPERMLEIPPGPVVVNCQGGGRSAIAASLLVRGGRESVANLAGGFTEWARRGNPVERSTAP